MKFKYLFILVVFMISIPNYFVKYDVTALTHNQGFDINQFLRITIYMILLYFTILLTLSKQVVSKKYLLTIKIPLLYYLFYSILVIFGNHIDLLKSYYRLAEWFTILFLIYYIQILQKRYFIISDFIRLVKILIWYSIFLIIIGLLFKKNMVYICSDALGLCRLGGYVIGPNSLGVIMGIGISYYLFMKKRANKYIIIFMMLTFMILTYSRGAMIGFAISLLPLLVAHNKYKHIFLIIFSFFIIIVFFNLNIIVDFLSRGQGLENLLTLSERYYVFIAAIDLIKENFLTGVGFVSGTKVISTIMQNSLHIDYWTNVHAHNEFLQAFASGGFLMLLFDIFVFFKTYKNIKKIQNNNLKVFLYSVYIQLLVFSFLMVTISFPVSIFNVLIWLLYIATTNDLKVKHV